ncbi:MAG: WD40 repeat domain-containing protein [Leifsonia sp.]
MCPYPGLRAYEASDAESFFGREDDVRAALLRLSRSPFLAVSGSSGCGKSSLVLAGIVPALRARGAVVEVLGSGALTVTALRDVLGEHARAGVVVVDQFEEIFHAGLPSEDVSAFCALLAGAVDAGRSVIVSVRSDYLDACAAEPSIGAHFAEGVHLVGPLSASGLRSAIEGPARRAGLRLETGLVELILRDAEGEPGALPHVSHALVETWLRREGATLTVAGYEESGGISGAIAQSADRLYQALDPEEREICRATLLRLIEIGSDGAPMRRRIPIRSLRDDPAHAQVLTSLEDARLISAEQDSVVVAHESLATAWPRLHGWLETDVDGTRTMNALAAAAGTWEADGRPDEDLYRGARLQAALEWQNVNTPRLAAYESEFLAASKAREQDIVDDVARRARHDRRQNRRLRVLLVAAVALFAVAATSAGLVAAGTKETEAQRTTARIEALTSTSLSLRGTDRDVAALLAVEAHRLWPDDPRTRAALMGAMTSAHGLLATTHLEGVDGMSGALIPGTRRAVAASDDKVAVYNVDTGELVYPVDLPKESPETDSRYGPAISGDGARVANAERIWDETDTQVGIRLSVADLTTGALIRPTIELDFPLSSITMNHEGDLIAAIDEIGTLRLIDADTGSIRQVTGTSSHKAQGATDRAGAARFTPGGLLVYGTVEGPMHVVDPGAAAVVATVPMPAESTNVAMTVVSDTRVITTGDHWISSVDLAARRADWTQQLVTTTDDPCPWVTASVKLRTVYCGDLFGHIDERSLDTGAPTERSFDPQLGFVGTMSVVEDRQELVVVGRGTAITRWKLDGSGAVTRVIAPGWVIRDGYSAAGSSLVVARRADGVEWWGDYREFAVLDTRTEEMLHVPTPSYGVMWAGATTLVGDFGGVGPRRTGYLDIRTGAQYPGDPLPESVESIRMSAPGDRLYVGQPGGEIWTIDPATGRRIEPTMQTDGGDPVLISTSPDGSRVLVTSWNMDFTPDSILFDAESGEKIRAGLVGIGLTALTARGEVAGTFRYQAVVRYDADTFERIGALPGASGGLDTVNVSADGRTLSTYSLDNTVTLYDLVGGVQLGGAIPVMGEWNYPMGLVYSGVIRADGAELAVNVPGGIALWDLRPSSHAAAACRMAGRDLTRDEWIAYLGEIGPYRSTCGYAD